MPMAAPEDYKLERRWSLTHFLIGVFGATAILGVMAKIFTFEAEIFGYLLTWKPVVLVGFMGEAIVFILMGMMREMQYVPADDTEDASSTASSPAPDALEEEDSLSSELKGAEEQLSKEAKRLARQIRDIRKDLSGQITVLEEFNDLTADLDGVVPAWRDYAATLGRRVRVTRADREVVGTAVDVRATGALVVETDAERVTVTAGDCEHLRPAD